MPEVRGGRCCRAVSRAEPPRVKGIWHPHVTPSVLGRDLNDGRGSGHLRGDGRDHGLAVRFSHPAIILVTSCDIVHMINHHPASTTMVVFFTWRHRQNSGDALIDPVVGDVTPAASNLLGILYFGTLYGLTGHLQVRVSSSQLPAGFSLQHDGAYYGCCCRFFGPRSDPFDP